MEDASGEGEQECWFRESKEDAMNRARWRVHSHVGVNEIAVRVG